MKSLMLIPFVIFLIFGLLVVVSKGRVEAKKPEFCIPVVTYAVQSSTKQCAEFHNPCEVPAGWKIVPACN